MKKNRMLVTGASGFIGRNVVEFFRALDGYEVFACMDETADLRDEAAVEKIMREFLPDVVVNCAAVGGTRKTGYDKGFTDVVAVNLRIFFNLVRALGPETRMFHLGSGAEYDLRHYQPRMKEDFFDSHVPEDPYGFSKYVISRHIEKTANITCLRIFGIYGKYDDYSFKFISNAIVRNLLKLPITINRNVNFDYLYIDDLSRILQEFINSVPKRRHYNITPGAPIDLVSIAQLINEASDFKSEIRVVNLGMNPEYSGDNTRLLGHLPGLTFTSYAEGIAALYNYYKAGLDSLDVEKVKRDEYFKHCR